MGETMIKERPILFTGPMVRAILDGSKTQTRRVIRDSEHYADWSHAEPLTPESHGGIFPGAAEGDWLLQKQQGPIRDSEYQPIGCGRYGLPGDELWVQESFRVMYGHTRKSEERWPGVSCMFRQAAP
ncbi:MAG: hypothetical protein AAGI54_08175 [Planctomycetota bacterium]